MTEVIPFRLQENSERAGAVHLVLGAIRPFSIWGFRSGTPALGFLGYRTDLAAVGASFLRDTFDHIAGMVMPRSSLIISDEPAEF